VELEAIIGFSKRKSRKKRRKFRPGSHRGKKASEDPGVESAAESQGPEGSASPGSRSICESRAPPTA
jgi:hypothetical protein